MKRRLVSLVLVLMLMLSSFSAFAEEEETINEALLEQILEYIEDYHYYEVDRETLIQGAYKGILDTLDKHSVYYSEEEYSEFVSTLNGEFIGVGVYIEEHEGYVKVISPIQGLPADLAGILTGDLITHVDGESTKDYTFEAAIDLILGEEDTPVTLTINRNGEVFDVTIIRKKIEVPDVEYEMLEDGVGYLRIIQFGNTVAKEVNDAIVELNQAGMTSIVIDLRNNPGGYLDQVVKLADWFIEAGDPILHVDYRTMQDENYYAKLSALNIPTAVLVNEGTASASEILAGAIKNNHEGIIIGTTTYGKGTVQNLISLGDGSALKLTTAEYLAAGEKPVNNIGIEPDIIVENKVNTPLDFVSMASSSLKSLHKEGLDVYGAQQRLDYLGYDVNLNGVYDQKTANVLYSIQLKYDLTAFALFEDTKDKLEAMVIDKYENDDPHLNKALEWIEAESN